MLHTIYHLLPPMFWMGAFVFLMIFAFIPIYFVLDWAITSLAILIEEVKHIYDVKRGERRPKKDHKNNT